ncbi:unnamed protein product [Cyclocybe aegerita]|uniref:Uncharacterized protein n=1 Tax=Cyclocybe aegerita TaxID=1973307 RepID=A0A8S0VR94_CYCAE|nr:unnamed protein product [Cyclocybe aegerita]
MAAVLNAFKMKEFDLEPIFEEWKDGPVFTGNTKKDLPVEEWLEKIREGCVQRGVPEEYWYKVAQHFMGPKAKARLVELKQVIAKVHGGKYRWTWKKFKVAMMNMGWTIDKDAKETIKVQGRGMWFNRKKDTTDSKDAAPQAATEARKPRPAPSRNNTIRITKKPIVEEPEEIVTEGASKTLLRRRPTRSATVSSQASLAGSQRTSGEGTEKAAGKVKEKELPQRPGHQKAKSDSAVATRNGRGKNRSHERSQTDGEVITTETQAPAWLLNACSALEFITSEHPKTMSIISAILITAGSIPAIPAIAAGAGGAVLASTTAHAIGAIAVGVGQALGATVQQSQKKQETSNGSGDK